MAKRIQFRRGSTAQHAVFVGAPGEITVDTDKNVVVVHNGVTPGGYPANAGGTFIGAQTFSGSVSITSNVASTSVTTGSLVVAGGVGVNGRITCVSTIETSSIAFKENVNPITNALDSVLKLVGTTYDRKDTKETESGFIAEDVNKILPNLVSKDEAGNPYGIKYTKLIAYLVEAVKEQQIQINELKKKI
jgi:hypothetical protein